MYQFADVQDVGYEVSQVICKTLSGNMGFAHPFVEGDMTKFGQTVRDIGRRAEYGTVSREWRAVADKSYDSVERIVTTCRQ